jgi:hypothetical protein
VRQSIPGWPYSIVAVLESGRSSWTAPLDALRLGPHDDLTEVTAAQIRDVVDRLQAAGQHTEADPPVLVVMDAGYDVVRLAWLLADLAVQVLARVRSDRVFYPAADGAVGPRGARPRRHGQPVKLSDESTWPDPDATHTGMHERYGAVAVTGWADLHQRLTRRAGWEHHPGPLPIVAGSLILVQVDRLPGDRAPKPVWLWHSHTDPADLDPARVFAAFLRRFDIEHTFRFLKQVLGWTKPRVRTGEQADRWTRLILTAYTQLRLARGMAEDLRRPWQPPLHPNQLTPGRVRRGFPRIRRTAGCPAHAPKPTRPGPGRPKGSHNSHPAPRYPVGKQPKVDTPTRKRCTKRR